MNLNNAQEEIATKENHSAEESSIVSKRDIYLFEVV